MKIFQTIGILSLALTFLWGEENTLEKANEIYQKGMQGTSYQEQIEAFNQSLPLYLSLEEKFSTTSLERSIGDNFFQLEQYPFAILHYYRALALGSSDEELINNFHKAQAKLNLASTLPHITQNPFSFYFFPFLALGLLTFLTLSMAIKKPTFWIKRLTFLTFSTFFLFLSFLLYLHFSLPLEGVMIYSSGFYSSPDVHHPQISKNPLLAGSKVQVLNITSDNEWIKIKNEEGLIGYVPLSFFRLI